MPPSITGLKKTLPSHSENTCFGCPVSCGDFHVRKPRISAQITGLKKTLSHTSLGCRKCSSITQWANSQVKNLKCSTHRWAVENAVSHISGHVFLQPSETLGNWKSGKPEIPHTSRGCRKCCFHISGTCFLQPSERVGNWKSGKPEMPHKSLGCRKCCFSHLWTRFSIAKRNGG